MVATDPIREVAPIIPPADAAPVDYSAFYSAVATRQLTDWLSAGPEVQRLLDVSDDAGRTALVCRGAGHDVVCRPVADLDEAPLEPFDAVVAERCALSRSIATEASVEAIAARLRPGGRLLMCVDSLVLGLSQLAEAGRWAELADAPAADVVLVPRADDAITRCFWPEELESLLDSAGLAVEWIRPRTVISGEAVARAVSSGPSLDALVETELALARERAGESIGIHLLASAVRR